MKYLRASLVPLALLIVGIVRALKYIGIRIRFGVMLSSRIGHLAGNMDTYLAERAAGMQQGIDLWTHYGEPANRAWCRVLGRKITIDPTGFTALLIKVNKLFGGWFEHEIPCDNLDRDPQGLRATHGAQVSLSAAEIRRGEAQLREWGVDGPWVCLIVRDAAYLPTLGYHSYRDGDVDDYGPAMLELAKRGYHVFRMGAKVAKPFHVKQFYFGTEGVTPRIHDYATNGMRSDFMDVYLGALCKFYVSTSTGWDAIPQAFRRPGCYANFVPYEYMPTWMPHSIAIWKHHYKDGRRMTLAEMKKSGCGQFMRAEQFERAGIELRPNTPQEITELVLEMLDLCARAERGYGAANTVIEQQTAFWSDFPISRSSTEAVLHGVINLRIGKKFLEAYHDQRDVGARGDPLPLGLQAAAE